MGFNILILGLAYKGNISDTRESPAASVIDELIERGAKLRVFDPKAVSINTQYGEFRFREKMDEEIKWADRIIILTDHQEFKENEDIKNTLGSKDKVIIDTRNTLEVTNGSKNDYDNYIKL